MDKFKTNIGHCLQISGKIYVWTIIWQTLDIHLPNFCPIFGQIRKWSKRLDIRRTNTWQKMDNCPNIWQILDITWTWANIGQTLDKTSTIIGYLSKICPIFVRSPVVQEHQGLFGDDYGNGNLEQLKLRFRIQNTIREENRSVDERSRCLSVPPRAETLLIHWFVTEKD